MFVQYLNKRQQGALLHYAHEMMRVDGTVAGEELAFLNLLRDSAQPGAEAKGVPLKDLAGLFNERLPRVAFLLDVVGMGYADQDFEPTEDELARDLTEALALDDAILSDVKFWVKHSIALHTLHTRGHGDRNRYWRHRRRCVRNGARKLMIEAGTDDRQGRQPTLPANCVWPAMGSSSSISSPLETRARPHVAGIATPNPQGGNDMNVNIVRWDPFKEFDRMFGATDNDWQPLVDIRETKDTYSVALELPAIEPQDVSIELKDDLLHISGERTFETNDETARVYRRERRYGKFSRSFRLPEDADADSITATAKNGVVTIAVGKSVGAQARAIEVQAA